VFVDLGSCLKLTHAEIAAMPVYVGIRLVWWTSHIAGRRSFGFRVGYIFAHILIFRLLSLDAMKLCMTVTPELKMRWNGNFLDSCTSCDIRFPFFYLICVFAGLGLTLRLLSLRLSSVVVSGDGELCHIRIFVPIGKLHTRLVQGTEGESGCTGRRVDDRHENACVDVAYKDGLGGDRKLLE
jgi:hypothetical protein